MKKIGVIGGGQLARMMIPASINLGLELKIFAETHDSPAALAVTQVGDYRDKKQLEAFARTVDVITFDHEHVPIDNLVGLRANGALIAPSPDALRLTHDKTVMRSALASIGMPQPLFFNEIKYIPSFEIAMHRGLWSFVLLFIFLILFNNISLLQFNQKEIWFFKTSFLIFLFINAPPPSDITVEFNLSFFKVIFLA